MEKNVIWIDENENDLGEVSLSKAHQEGLLHRISVVYLTKGVATKNYHGKLLRPLATCHYKFAVHEGVKYSFCSDYCKQQFEKNPKAFITK